MTDFQRLQVWHRSHAMTLEVFRSSATVRDSALRFLMDQLRRASASIGANIAEGSAQDSPAQFARFLSIALGSTSELMNHVLLARDLGAFSDDTAIALEANAKEVRAMLVALQRTVRNQHSKP